jgi:RNA polymerase sigma-70 factor (ECF subfamily)
MNSLDFLTNHIGDIYGYAVNRTVNTDDAADLAQDILTAAVDAFGRNPGVSDRERFMWKIANNIYVDHVRRGQKSKDRIEFTLLSNILPASEPEPTEITEKREEISLMKREIARLSEIRRKIVIMHYFEEQPLKDIAQKLSLPVGNSHF